MPGIYNESRIDLTDQRLVEIPMLRHTIFNIPNNAVRRGPDRLIPRLTPPTPFSLEAQSPI